MSCNGDCCVAFTLSIHPGEVVMGRTCDDPGNNLERLRILGMLVPLTREEATTRLRALAGKPDDYEAHENAWFMCRHWDEDTRLCTVYDQRPYMCRQYPATANGLGSKPCDHGCDCKGSPFRPFPLYTRHCVGELEMDRDRRRRARVGRSSFP